MSVALTRGNHGLLGAYRVLDVHICYVGLEQIICGENFNAVENKVCGVKDSADDVAQLPVEVKASLGDIAVNSALILVAAEGSALL